MVEELVPGDYTALEDINIRVQMNTQSFTNVIGGYKNGDPFKVYEVFPERNGIIWGRVSSNTGGGQIWFVGLRVNNHPKAKLTRPNGTVNDELSAMLALSRSIDALTAAVLQLALKK